MPQGFGRSFLAQCESQKAAWPRRQLKNRYQISETSSIPELSSGFRGDDVAAGHLHQRWALLREEGRLGQLRWEANSVLRQEPGLDAAKLVLQSLPPSVSQPRARVVVASLFAGQDFARSMLPARSNHERWCALHGYSYACLEENIAGRDDPTWSKILHVLNLLEAGAEFVFWMDADSLFIHDAVDLQWACDLDKDFVFAGDLNVVFNAGHFLARKGSWSHRFLSDAFRIFPWPHWEDNGAMMIMLGGGSADDQSTWHPAFERMKVPTRSTSECQRAMRELLPAQVAEHVEVVPQHRMNAYEWPHGGGIMALLRGDPILHFAGCSPSEKVGLVRKFAGCTGDPSVLLKMRFAPRS